MACTARTALALALLGLAAAAAYGHEQEQPADPNRFQRLGEFARAYATRKGLPTMTDEDIKCLLQLGEALRSDTQHSTGVQQAVNLYTMATRTTPRCKVRLLTRARLFVSADFAKGALGILLNQDLDTSTSH